MKAYVAISLAIKKAPTVTTAKVPKNLILLPANTRPHSSVSYTKAFCNPWNSKY